jgi:hypothetical protein
MVRTSRLPFARALPVENLIHGSSEVRGKQFFHILLTLDTGGALAAAGQLPQYVKKLFSGRCHVSVCGTGIPTGQAIYA